MTAELLGKAAHERTQEEPDILQVIAGKLDEVIELLQRQVEALGQLNPTAIQGGFNMQLAPTTIRGVPPATSCGRCGNPYGVGGHGPGFCLDRIPREGE